MIKTIIKVLTATLSVVLLVLPIELKSLERESVKFEKPRFIISDYDYIFQKVASEIGVDWHLLSAIAYKETGYQCGLRSRRGAVGLMQIMPSTARHFNVPEEMLEDPFMNVTVSAKLLKEIENSLKLDHVSEKEKVKIILAGYNSGITNLKNARKLAAEAGIDYNNWEQLKHFGKIQNKQTRDFVTCVYKKWNEYQKLTASLN